MRDFNKKKKEKRQQQRQHKYFSAYSQHCALCYLSASIKKYSKGFGNG